ncbi:MULTISPECIES: ABC transporter ATP-binding protein [Bacillaceae]|uniref:ABC transporter ATP-binding protein n=1 Tax=Bacillaceae TaxID=186817 RepID=UPI0006F8E656|nr:MULTISPECIES: ABC transporter ATP-binding protein [Bacillaceae]KQL34604.1 spermidine/putrescine ABC transporter ATP-binding protein [Psychrobacillus sp. FJAT-21963]MDF2068272.1 ABC transporter ATP-binding protein [Bacillus sp. Cr_A10]
MIQLNEVTRKYGKKEAVKNVTVTFPKGRIIGLVGENGSGKSTLLKMMSGVAVPQHGKITLDGVNVSHKTANYVAYLPDADEIYPYFTVKQLFRYYDSQFTDFNYDKACIVAQFLEVDLNASLKKLSKGNRGRAKIAATLGREVDYYLLDEPLSGLDPMVRQSIIKGFIQFVDTESQTIILSTHELKDVEPILDDIVVLRNGTIIANESVEAIREIQRIDITTWMTRLFREGEIDGNKANS